MCPALVGEQTAGVYIAVISNTYSKSDVKLLATGAGLCGEGAAGTLVVLGAWGVVPLGVVVMHDVSWAREGWALSANLYAAGGASEVGAGTVTRGTSLIVHT